MSMLLKKLVIILLGFACLLCIMLSVGAVALAYSWETAYRIPVMIILIVSYGLGVGIAWWRFQRLSVQANLTSPAFYRADSHYPRSIIMRFLTRRLTLLVMLMAELQRWKKR